jgi:hypothetical protein
MAKKGVLLILQKCGVFSIWQIVGVLLILQKSGVIVNMAK